MHKKHSYRQIGLTLGIVIFAFGTVTWRNASAETFIFDGQTIFLSPPDGYCALDPQNALEKVVIDQQQRVQSGYSEVPMVYGDW